MSDSIDLSIILPIHNERENLRPLLEEIERAMATANRRYEVIAVDDGSTDQSPDVLRQLLSEKPYLRAIFFRRNHGQSAAFDAGFRHARGQIIVTMDADGQNDPADIPRMVALLDAGYDFVAGRRIRRRDGFFLRKLPSRIANWIIRRVTRTRLRDLGCSLKAYRRTITDELRLYGEMHRFLAVLVESIGARVIEIDVNHRPRLRGRSKYGLTRTLKVLLDLVTVWFIRGYQTKPIYVFGGVGFLLLLLGGVVALYVLYEKLAGGIWVHRNPLFILAAIFAVIGVQFLALGLLSEMVVRTYFESQGKNSYLIASVEQFHPAADASSRPETAGPNAPDGREAT